jgi:hypothetical protein
LTLEEFARAAARRLHSIRQYVAADEFLQIAAALDAAQIVDVELVRFTVPIRVRPEAGR